MKTLFTSLSFVPVLATPLGFNGFSNKVTLFVCSAESEATENSTFFPSAVPDRVLAEEITLQADSRSGNYFLRIASDVSQGDSQEYAVTVQRGGRNRLALIPVGLPWQLELNKPVQPKASQFTANLLQEDGRQLALYSCKLVPFSGEPRVR